MLNPISKQLYLVNWVSMRGLWALWLLEHAFYGLAIVGGLALLWFSMNFWMAVLINAM